MGGLQQLWLEGMWNLPAPGIEHMFPALAGRFLSIAPSEKFNLAGLYFLKVVIIHLG